MRKVAEETSSALTYEEYLFLQEGTAKTVELKKKSSLTRKGTHQQRASNSNVSSYLIKQG